ncbi:MAG: Radical SAM domain protein [Parcubacteria group bacterium GW2011_GWF1_45_5]|nr:MAG: Radical SAM domain protein [Parcubacteria group bacterium GW2011_GWF1_45_5]
MKKSPESTSLVHINKEKVGFFRFKELKGKYLVTNDSGCYLFLTKPEFKKFIQGKLDKKSSTYKNLQANNFIKDDADLGKSIEICQQRNVFLFQGPSLHIVVVTLRCNYNCVYCQASSRGIGAKGMDMDKKTARAVVNTIFQSPSKDITIEFQGGEPLLNWPIVRFIVELAEQKNRKAKKNLFISLVTNLSLMDGEKHAYLVKHSISICTSLDGPESLHNANRPFAEGDSYRATTAWIKKIKAREKKDSSLYKLGALVTISKYSLKYPKDIVDEYRKWGFYGVHLRPLSLLGLSGKFKNSIGYSVPDFLKFWEKAMDYIIGLNLKGKFFYERGSAIMLRKIMGDLDPNFLDLRSPCGAGIGQILYNYDGKVYTCDEGRMLGEDTFILGNVLKHSYKELVSHPNLRVVCQASILENSACDYCAYKPYCGVCPVLNYALYGDLFAPGPDNYQCQLHMGMLDYLFDKLQNKKVRGVFEKWMGLKKSNRKIS